MKINFKFLAPLILGVLFSFLGNAQNGYNASRVTWSPAVDTVAVTYKPNGTSVRYLDDDLYFKRRGIWTKWTNAGGGSFTANNGITLTGSNFQWGGALIQNTTVSGAFFINWTVPTILYQDNQTYWNNPAGTFRYDVRTSAITAARNITLPLLTADGGFMMTTTAPTLNRVPFLSNTGGYIDDSGLSYDPATKIFLGSFIRTANSTSAQAQFNLSPTGTVPTTPNSGDVWHNSAANTLQMRIGGLTQNIITGNLTNTRIPFAQANGWLVDDTNFSYSTTTGMTLNNPFTNNGGSVAAGAATSTTLNAQSVTGAGTAAGNVNIGGGASSVTGVPGGNVVISAGNAGTGTANGGSITFSGGNGVGGGTVGNISFIGGGTSKVQMNHLSGKTSGVASLAGGGGGGTGPTITSVNPTDLAGEIRILTGTTPTAAATILTITLSRSFDAADFHVLLTPANVNAAALNGTTQVFTTATAANSFTVTAGSAALTAGTQYNWNYFIVQ